MRLPLWMAVAVFALVGGPAASLAFEDDSPAEEDVWRESIVVSASRAEQQEADVAANVTVLDAKDLQRTAALTADDALRQVPGFSLFRRSSSLVAHPTSQGVSLRGIGPSGVSRTLVLLDGVPLNDPFGGWVYWSRVPLASLERVEVMRGGSSSLWGNFALGGVVQLFTESPTTGTFSLMAEAGDHQTGQLDVSAGERWERTSLFVSGNVFDTDGFHVLRADQRGSIDIPAFSEHLNGGVRLGFYPGDSISVSLRGGYFEEDRGNGTPLTGNDTDAVSFSAGVVASGGGGAEWNGSVFAHDQTFASRFSSQAADRNSERPALDQFDVDSTGFGLGLQWLRSFDGGEVGQLITAGAEFRRTDGTTREHYFFSGDDFLNRREAGGEQSLSGLFLQDTLDFGERLQLQFGARVDRWESEDGFRLQTRRSTGAVLRDERPPDRDETEFSPRVSMLYKPRAGVGLRASAYEAFRAPTINELFRPFRVGNDITEANAELNPEELLGLELGADLRGRRVRGKLTAFWNQVDDPIANVTLALGPGVIAPCGFTPGGGSCRQRQNLDRTEIVGWEAEFDVRPNPHWRFNVSYLMSDAEIRRAPGHPELEGNRLAQVPESQAVAGLGYTSSRGFDVSILGRYLDEQFEDDLNSRELAAVTTVGLAISSPVGDRWNVFLRFENLFDEEVEVGESASGLVAIGTPFLVHGGFRFRLGG